VDHPAKKSKLAHIISNIVEPVPWSIRISPASLIWDSQNWSCAYDATFTILGNMCLEDGLRWEGYMREFCELLTDFAAHMRHVSSGAMRFEQARNKIRRKLHTKDPGTFPNRPNCTSIDKLAQVLLPEKCYGTGRQICMECRYVDSRSYGILESYLSAALNNRVDYPNGLALQTWLFDYLSHGRSACPHCHLNGVRTKMVMKTK
jgi:hypothetical protein